MIEVFKTSVSEPAHAENLVAQLVRLLPGCKVNFDLDDCDRVLRVEGQNFTAGSIVELVTERGHSCAVLD
jgi:hypothetical protein